MKYLSLFSGIGGFELGIQHAYENFRNNWEQKSISASLFPAGDKPDNTDTEWWQSYPECVGFSEIDKYATKIYQEHFPKHPSFGDIRKINARALPDFDLLVGGFPCQSFSVAGLRKGFDDTRGTLFFEIARIVKEKQPRLLLLENVKGLLNHDSGRTFGVIIRTLDELGYDVQWQVLNSKNFGVPQNRERVYIIGHLRRTPRPKVFPIFGQSAADTGTRGNDQQGAEEYIATRHLGRNGGLTSKISATVQASEVPHIVESRVKHGKTPYPMENCPTISAHWGTGGNNVPLVMPQIRRLTPIECERLQGFPDNWTQILSDSQRYKCLGNAVTVNVVEAIMTRLCKQMT